MREAAGLRSRNPDYWYLLWTVRSFGLFSGGRFATRPALERTLAADPHYLPALYDYALTKATSEQRIRALESIARLDTDNARPYYLMAVEQYTAIVEDREALKESDWTAFALSEQEWGLIVDLLRKGNERAGFRRTGYGLPSVQDVQVSTRGKVWPALAVRNHEIGTGGQLLFEIGFNASARQLARQAAWEAKKMLRSGERDRALESLHTARRFGEALAASEPRSIISLCNGWAVSEIVLDCQAESLRGTEEAEWAQKERLAWKQVLKNLSPLFAKTQVKVKGLYIAKNESLSYTDYATEEAGITSILRRLKLVQ